MNEKIEETVLDSSEPMIDSMEAQTFLGVKRSLMFKLIKENKIKSYHLVGNKRTFYRMADIETLKKKIVGYRPKVRAA